MVGQLYRPGAREGVRRKEEGRSRSRKIGNELKRGGRKRHSTITVSLYL